jgi:hypothetical protein
MVEVKLSNPKSMAERINDRLESSGRNYGEHAHLMADIHDETYPTRTHHHIHHGASQDKHGSDAVGLDIHGKPRKGV